MHRRNVTISFWFLEYGLPIEQTKPVEKSNGKQLMWPPPPVHNMSMNVYLPPKPDTPGHVSIKKQLYLQTTLTPLSTFVGIFVVMVFRLVQPETRSLRSGKMFLLFSHYVFKLSCLEFAHRTTQDRHAEVHKQPQLADIADQLFQHVHEQQSSRSCRTADARQVVGKR